jgi:DeoR/GlpR family transcriptional regulator of sugar metabolism
VLPRRQAREPHFVATRRVNARTKAAIARAAALEVADDQVVALSAGTTTWQIAKQLRGRRDLRFITNSLNVALALEEEGWSSIVLLGGDFRTPSDALVGPLATQAARQLHSDVLFVGAHSVDVRHGLTTPNLAEAELNRVLVGNTARVVVVADSTKLGHSSLAEFASVREIDVLVTDTGASGQVLERFRAAGVEVVAVGAPADTGQGVAAGG